MDVTKLLDRHFLFVVGKGGVGKTSVSAALGLRAAAQGKRTLIAMANAQERLSTLFECEPIGADIVNVAPGLDAVNLEPQRALEEYGMMVLKVRALYKAVFENRFVRAFLRGTPGLEAWSMLGKAFFHASPPKGAPEYDLVILDAQATGHGLDMLRVPLVIQQIAPPGLLRREADRAVKMFRDASQSGVVLVTLPENMPTNETMELHAVLRDELQFPVLGLVINRMLPSLFPTDGSFFEALRHQLNKNSPLLTLAQAARRRALRERVQQESITRLKEEIPAPQTTLPHLLTADFQREQVEMLAAAL